ncbi:MAG: hypothetical protein HY550_03030 [Elusimicrobia bacterium]|nr:hypothetical protein [Elusimicrobiota bacterium]
MKNVIKVLTAMAVCASFFARQAQADVVFEEITGGSGMPMGGGGGNKTKVLISGDKYRAQKKMTMDAGSMADSMKMSQQMSGVSMGIMNQVNRGGKPDYPDHIMTVDEWGEFEENKQLMDEVLKNSAKPKGLFGKLKADIKKDFTPGGGNTPQKKTVEDVIQKYCQEFDSGIMEKKKDEMADQIAAQGGMGMMSLAQVTDYDTWLRAKIIRGSCGGGGGNAQGNDWAARTESRKGRQTAAELGRVNEGPKTATFSELIKISDDKTPEYRELKRKYELNSEYKAEYAKGREKGKEMAGRMNKAMDSMMKEGMAEAFDAMLSVQIIRLDTGKVIELFPPKDPKDPKPEDVTYKEESLDDVREKAEAQKKNMQKAMKGNEAAMRDGEAAMAAARAKYGDAAIDQATGGKPAAKKLANETINGIPCEHWQLKGASSTDDYWVSNKFSGADEIIAFEAKLKEKTGTGRGGIAFGMGGMPDMSAMASGTNPAMDAEVEKIKARGIVIKKVNTMKGAAPSQAGMLNTQKMMGKDIGASGAAQKAQTDRAMAGMSDKQKMAMMKDPAAFQKMMGGDRMAADMQASAEKHQAAGDFDSVNEDRQDVTNTYELKLVGTNPVPAAAFEPPAGAKKVKK